MKKTVKLLAVILAMAACASFMFACSDTAGLQTDIDKLKQEIADLRGGNSVSSIDELKVEIDELKQQNGEQQEQLDKVNVFWTEKEEYSQDETMTIYYGKKAVLHIKIKSIYTGVSNVDTVSSKIYITSLLTNLYTFSILQTAYITHNNEIYLNRGTYDNNDICKKNIETTKGSYYVNKNGTFIDSQIDYTICVPGTPFPLASFKNVLVSLES